MPAAYADVPHFDAMHAPEPDFEALTQEYDELTRRWEAAAGANGSPEARLEFVRGWDTRRREIHTWGSLTSLRFNQNTKDPAAKAARARLDELRPKLNELDSAIKKLLLESEHRAELEAWSGRQPFDLWAADVKSSSPAVEADLVAENKLQAAYIELLAGAQIEFQGETRNLSGLLKFNEDLDREVRHRARQAYFGWFQENGAELDRIYDELVTLRTRIAQTLGFASFTELGYLRMHRVDYGPEDVERFRAEVREHVVPLAHDLRRQQQARLGLERLYFWDTPILDEQPNPAPVIDADAMRAQAQVMFDEFGLGLGEFFRLMNDKGLLDLLTREGKAGGGFCTSFPTYKVPFVFANFNGTKGDVRVFTHELGHAFQNYLSQDKPLSDVMWATHETAEIHSMSLEYLTWPAMDRFFGADAERFRRLHLSDHLWFLPYGVAVDHFQHLVYDRPQATPEERHAMWQECERTYLPWIDYGDVERAAAGGFWQSQRHIYFAPFYYIDYTLALTCALQLWERSLTDREGALTTYQALCQRGGEAAFGELVAGAGLRSPFEPGCLQGVVAKARAYLGA